MSPVSTTQALHRIHDADDVATALRDLVPGEQLSAGTLTIVVSEPVPAGHKIALRDIAAHASVIKYGAPIGHATQAIGAGAHVHVHNVATHLSGTDDYRYEPAEPSDPPNASPPNAEFLGYRRASGQVGTRNEIWIVCTVGCVARTAEQIALQASQRFSGRVDGVHAFTHPFGCSQLGDDLAHTRAALAGLVRHPNAGGVLLIGLGCENNRLDALLATLDDDTRSRVRSFNAQFSKDEIEEGLAAVEALVANAETARREPCPLSSLVIGLKCGGSDGFSGMTANALVGQVANRLAAAGGTPVLSEIPEMFGAERLLMARCTSASVFDDVVAVVNDFKRYFLDHGQPIYENPSPGNIAGGITTLEEKSLGAVQKGGSAPVTQVRRYGEPLVPQPGLAIVEAPGNDAVSSTALTAAGATLILFTTGRGTPLGFPVPTLKIASNTALAERKPNWIDFDAGRVLIDALAPVTDDLMALIVATASGQPARNERNGQREIALWKSGVTL